MRGPTRRDVFLGGAAAAAAGALPGASVAVLSLPSRVSPPAPSVLGRVIKQLVRGYVLVRRPDGHTIVQAPDGHLVGEPSAGRVIKQFVDGRVLRQLPNGEIVRELPDGDELTPLWGLDTDGQWRSRGYPSSGRIELEMRWHLLEHRANVAAKSGSVANR
jgi:hypothetical protein